ncbi:MAG: alanine:cation symporter family protein [Bilophila wadsworthia]
MATAILSGGPGALFWMWCTAMVGMATKFSEILLAVRYREVTPAGISWAGPCTSSRTVSAKMKWLGGLFAIFAGNHLFRDRQCGTDQRHFRRALGTFGVPTWITALILFLLIASVLLATCGASAAWPGK